MRSLTTHEQNMRAQLGEANNSPPRALVRVNFKSSSLCYSKQQSMEEGWSVSTGRSHPGNQPPKKQLSIRPRQWGHSCCNRFRRIPPLSRYNTELGGFITELTNPYFHAALTIGDDRLGLSRPYLRCI